MNDRELLELAAKVAGLSSPSGDDDIWFDAAAGHDVQWNPLLDDGDALRLAVKLRITPHIDTSITDAESVRGFCTEPHFDDPYAATRRAIVRAAAEIGKTIT